MGQKVYGSHVSGTKDWLDDWFLVETASVMCGWHGNAELGWTSHKGRCRKAIECMQLQYMYDVGELMRVEDQVLDTMAKQEMYFHNLAVIGGYDANDQRKCERDRNMLRIRKIMRTNVSQRYHALTLTVLERQVPIPGLTEEENES